MREWPSAAGLAVFADAEPDNTIDRRLLEIKGDAEAAIASLAGEQCVARAHPRAYFHPGAAGDLLIGDTVVAKFGRLHPKLARAYELPTSSYAFALYLENLPQYSPTRVFTPLPRFPATKRDIAVVVPAELPASDLVAGVRESGAPYVEQVQAFDEYRGRQIGEGRKSVALQITLRRPDGTLTDEEANASKDAIVAALAKRFGATLRE
ncbi:MAG: hypothetical protein JOZ50_01895 [Candidatus Eremiobacteraeota bacterium]|nr:hypothetical protein [Candidatus Eremiobacteraeota bacterium]